MVAIWSVLVGTIPSGRETFANWVSILLGFIVMLFHVVFTSEFTINKTGRFDIFTEIYLRCARDKEFLLKLKADTVKAFETGQPVKLKENDKLVEGDDVESGPSLNTNSWDISDRTDEDTVGGAEKQKEDLDDSWADQPLDVKQQTSESPVIEQHFSIGDVVDDETARHSHEQ